MQNAEVNCAALRSDYAYARDTVCFGALPGALAFHWSLFAALIYCSLLAFLTIFVNIRLGGVGQYNECSECLMPGLCILCGKTEARARKNRSPFNETRPRAVTIRTAKKYEVAAAYSTPVDYIDDRMGRGAGSKVEGGYEDSGRIRQHQTRMF